MEAEPAPGVAPGGSGCAGAAWSGAGGFGWCHSTLGVLVTNAGLRCVRYACKGSLKGNGAFL